MCASGVSVLSSIHQMYRKGFWSLQLFSVNKQQAPNAVKASRSCSTGDPLAAGSLSLPPVVCTATFPTRLIKNRNWMHLEK